MKLALLTYLYIIYGNTVTIIIIFDFIAILLSIFVLIFIYVEYIDSDYDRNIIKFLGHNAKILRIIGIMFIMLNSILVLYPDKNDIKLIAGAYMIDSVSEVKGINELPENIVESVNAFLEKINGAK